MLLRVSVPVRVPCAIGLKVTLTEQLAPAARVDPHVWVWLKSPVMLKFEMVSVALPVLVRVAVCAVLEEFKRCAA